MRAPTIGSRDIRWWRVGPAMVIAITASTILISRWSAIDASHPAYLITLVVVLAVSLVIAATGVGSRPPDPVDEPTIHPPRWQLARRAAALLAVALLLGVLLYLRPLPASSTAVDAMSNTSDVNVDDSATRIVLRRSAQGRQTGLVFFPGALVDPRAYVSNLKPLAEAGYFVVIVKPPFNIALLDSGAARDVMDANPKVGTWVVGGHSLGGVTASSVGGSGDRRIAGLLLWASFPNGSIADRTRLDVTSVSGSEDALATPAKIEASADNLPPDTDFVTVVGGTHAFFGDYGEQSGDGTPTITRADAQAQIRDASLDLLDRVDAG